MSASASAAAPVVAPSYTQPEEEKAPDHLRVVQTPEERRFAEKQPKPRQTPLEEARRTPKTKTSREIFSDFLCVKLAEKFHHERIDHLLWSEIEVFFRLIREEEADEEFKQVLFQQGWVEQPKAGMWRNPGLFNRLALI